MMSGFVDQETAKAIDRDLFELYSLDQLMELAGLSVAQCVFSLMPRQSRILVVVGPGNNGGDALVAARHLSLFGHVVSIWIAHRTKFDRLVQQCLACGVVQLMDVADGFDFVLDGLFGFGFVARSYEPCLGLDFLLKTKTPIISIDVPSGWPVDGGDDDGDGLITPVAVISLTIPKKCMENAVNGSIKHFLGGRFLPISLSQKYNLIQYSFPDASQFVEL